MKAREMIFYKHGWALEHATIYDIYIYIYKQNVCDIVCDGTGMSIFKPAMFMCDRVSSTVSFHPCVFYVVIMYVKF